MTRRRRAKLAIKVAIALLIFALGILFVAASVMAHIYDTPARNDDARLSNNVDVIQPAWAIKRNHTPAFSGRSA
jgi:hypothetical protein